MFGRMALPLLGGAPAVWNTTLVFYQAVLLAGYAYAHVATAWLGARRQAVVHLGLMLLPLLSLPIAIPTGATPPSQENPIPWLLALLATAVGLPFFVVSTTNPLLQKWFAGTAHPAAADPYFLYAASNLGSMLGLVAYPLLLEPHLRLREQTRLWAGGYAVLLVLTAACAIALWRAPRTVSAAPAREVAPGGARERAGARAELRRRLRWMLLAFVPSSLMLGVTTYLSTDVAPIPLFWVVPLAIYLLTGSLVFAPRPPLPHRLMVQLLPFAILPLVMVLVARATGPLALVMPPHLLALFFAAMVCHGELAADRPATSRLTEFYFWISLGGVVGGVFTALVAPLVFAVVLEYPLALILACLLTPALRPAPAGWRPAVLDVVLPVALGGVAVGLLAVAQGDGSPAARANVGLVFGLLVLIAGTFCRRPVRFGLGIGVVLLAGTSYLGQEGRVLRAERTFFGIHRVTVDPAARFHLLLHGTTLHGMQSLDPTRRREPLAYGHATGPVGQLFAALRGTDLPRTVAVVGLGTGSLACHGERGQRWTFYEIDPAVERIARDVRFFTFMRDCPPDVTVVLGDARRSLARAPSGQFDLMILDAYSSDAPPLHLITREALALYLDRLSPHGILAFHISNRHVDFEPALAGLAQDAGLTCLFQEDAVPSPAQRADGKRASRWAVMARSPGPLGRLAADPRWRLSSTGANGAVWTDDFASLVGAFRWRPERN